MSADDWDTNYQYDNKLMNLMMQFGRSKPKGFKSEELITFLESQGYQNAKHIVDAMEASMKKWG